MRVTLIHNPSAGSEQPDGSQLTNLIRRAGHEVRYESCSDGRWAEVLRAPADLVAVAGGDGTVGRVAKKMVRTGIPVAPLPLGTANNISRTLGLTDATLEEIVDSWAPEACQSYDAGIAEGPWGRRHFLEGCGMGLFVATMLDADERIADAGLEDAGEKVAYVHKLLRERMITHASRRLDITLDGRDVSGDYVMLEAMNMQLVGPNLYLAPQADLTDGQLDIALVPREKRRQLYDYLKVWQSGNLLPPDLPLLRGAQLDVQWCACELHIDDEIWPERGAALPATPQPVRLSVDRAAVQFMTGSGLH